MSHQSELIATDIEAYLQQQQHKELLRLLTCGSVDDGKSTLIGRLLFDAKMIYEDQLAAIERDSKTQGSTGGDFDPALLTDGLKAEREQGITIDVAYRYFSTARRKFIIADTPGHEQYTRNMATGASNCDLAVILIDARHGVVTQTRRHSFIVSLLGIRHVIVAVNKMDLVHYSQDVFQAIQSDYMSFAARMEMDDIRFIPISALKGANVVDRSADMDWYQGSTLMHMLENITIASDRNLIDFRLPVQYVNRPHADFRGYCGTVASGVVRPGDAVMILPSRRTTRVRSIVTQDGELEQAFAPHAVTLTLEDDVDVSRGDVVVHPGNVPRVSSVLDAMVVWMSDEALVAGKRYLFKHCTRTIGGVVSELRYQIDVNTLQRAEASTPDCLLALNEIGRCAIRLNEPIACDDYADNRSTGAFIVVDVMSNATVAAGMILDRLSSEDAALPVHGHWDTAPLESLRASVSQVPTRERQAHFGQHAVTVLLTGLSGAGKTSIALALERKLFDEGHAVALLDGEQLRLGLNRDLGFTEAERSEALRRSAELAATINDAGLLCVCALTAPDQRSRDGMAAIVGSERFVVVHVDAPIELCRERDEAELYRRADAGEIDNVPGVSFDYEAPVAADLVLATAQLSIAQSVERLMSLLRERGALRA